MSSSVNGIGPLVLIRLSTASAYRFVYIFLPVVALGLGISPAHAGLFIAARSAAGLAMPLIVFHSRRRISSRSLAAASAAIFAIGGLLMPLHAIAALFGFICMGAARPVLDIAAIASVGEATIPGREGRALGAFELTWSGGLLVGAPVAALLIGVGSWSWPFLAFSVLALAGAARVGFSARKQKGREIPSPRQSWQRPGFVSLGAVGMSLGLAAELVLVGLGWWIDNWTLSIGTVGLASVALGLAELMGAGLVSGVGDRWGIRRTALLGSGLACLTFGLLGIQDFGLWAGAGLLAIGLMGVEISTVGLVSASAGIAPTERMRYLSTLVVSAGFGRVLAGAGGAWLATEISFRANAASAALASIVTVWAIATRVQPDHRDRTSDPHSAHGAKGAV